MTFEEHSRFRPDHESRVAGRLRLHGEDAADALFALERATVGEEDSEPEAFA